MRSLTPVPLESSTRPRSRLRRFMAMITATLLVASGLTLTGLATQAAPAQAVTLEPGLITIPDAGTKFSSIGHRVGVNGGFFETQLISPTMGKAFVGTDGNLWGSSGWTAAVVPGVSAVPYGTPTYEQGGSARQ